MKLIESSLKSGDPLSNTQSESRRNWSFLGKKHFFSIKSFCLDRFIYTSAPPSYASAFEPSSLSLSLRLIRRVQLATDVCKAKRGSALWVTVPEEVPRPRGSGVFPCFRAGSQEAGGVISCSSFSALSQHSAELPGLADTKFTFCSCFPWPLYEKTVCGYEFSSLRQESCGWVSHRHCGAAGLQVEQLSRARRRVLIG